jgi:hypothetical protein
MASAFRRHRGDLVAQLDQTERALVVGLMEQTREILAPRQLAGGPDGGAGDLDPFEALVASLREPVGLSDQPLDPALERLLPLGHRGDETVAAEFRRLTEQDLREHCRQHLTGYKRPRDIEFRTEPLPRTNLGKVLRRQLRDAQAARPGVATLPAPAAGLRAA